MTRNELDRLLREIRRQPSGGDFYVMLLQLLRDRYPRTVAPFVSDVIWSPRLRTVRVKANYL